MSEEKGKYSADDIEREASQIVSDLWTNHNDTVVFITEKVAFRMKDVIRDMRKNYWGVFDKPIDPVTGRKKIWVPLTESSVDSVVKNIDLDTKDVDFVAKKVGAIPLTSLIRAASKNELEKMNFDGLKFSEFLDASERDVAIDGTFVWKTYEEKKDGRNILKVKRVDLLNLAIDGTAPNIQDAEGVVERAVISRDEFEKMDIPFNKDEVVYSTFISRNDDLVTNTQIQTSTKFVTLYEYWGLAPEYLITGKKGDDKLVEVRILCSGDDNSFVLHDIEKNTKGYKPYEECWYRKINGRWYGKGIAEKLAMLQLWINTVVNIRINRHQISQLGLFKLRKGSGVTAQSLSKLGTNGLIQLNNLQDLEPMIMQEASASSYKDEDVINGWAARLTALFGSDVGEPMPASTPATNAVLNNRSSQSEFTMVKEGIGGFLERWYERHALPVIKKNLKKDLIVRITENPEERRALDERIVNTLAYNELKKIRKKGKLVDEEKVLSEMEKAKEKLEMMGESRFSQLVEDLDLMEYDVKVKITNEDGDKSVIVQNLLAMLQTVTNFPTIGINPVDIVREIYDQLGLNPPKSQNKRQEEEQIQGLERLQGGGQQQGIPQVPTANDQQITTNANTL